MTSSPEEQSFLPLFKLSHYWSENVLETNTTREAIARVNDSKWVTSTKEEKPSCSEKLTTRVLADREKVVEYFMNDQELKIDGPLTVP